MTEYVIDMVIENVWHSQNVRNQENTFYIKIDANGNVNIKRQMIYVQNGQPNIPGPLWDIVSINDNIPIPTYMIDMLKNSFCQPTEFCKRKGLFGSNCGDQLFINHYINAIENVIILKESLAKSSEILIDFM